MVVAVLAAVVVVARTEAVVEAVEVIANATR